MSALRFEVYEPRHISMALAFNARMRAGGVDPRFLLQDSPPLFDPDSPLSTQAWVAADAGEIRGGYLLQWRAFSIHGEIRRVCAYQTPISEGIIDRKFAGVGALMIRHALSVNPLIYAVGMGGPSQ